ncbi:MAG: NMD protein affecting ribosome stability and mRNA decay [Halobacteriales archaeon]|jgi:NMD protein affecting ribosome stability and mRNA decay
MDEAYVQLLCPECTKDWQTSPSSLPDPKDMLHCPNCHATRLTAEFMRTERDLQTLENLH